jgi:tape measure domain-containing protein
MLGGEIKVVMTLDNGQFTIQTQKAGQTIQELKKTIEQTGKSTEALENHFTGLYGRFRTAIQTASMLRYALHDIHDVFMALPGAILKTSGEMEKLTKLMQGMSRETSEAARRAEALSNVKFVFDLAQTTPFDVKTLTDSFVKLKSGGLDPTNGSMKGLLDSIAKFGGGSEQVHRASIAIQQMAGKGVISMEELRQQLGEAVPNAINMMADGAGMSMQKFAKLVQTGTVEASTSLRNMFAIMQVENKGASEALMDTWSGMLSLLKTKFELFKVDAGNAGFFDEAKKGLQDMIDAFDTLGAKNLAYEIGQALGQTVIAIRDLVKFFREYGDVIKTVGELMLFYFGASKMMEIGAAIKRFGDARVAIYRKEVSDAQDAIRQRADVIRTEANVLRARANEYEKFAARQTQIAGQMYAEQAKYANQIADLEKRNLGWAGQQKIDRLQSRMSETRDAVMEVQAVAVARRAEAEELRKVADAKERVANATLLGQSASKADIALVAAANANVKKMTDSLNEKAAATTRVATGVGLMHRALAGGQAIFAAFGGWVTIAITALAYLAEKLYAFLNRWKEAEAIQKRIKAGVVGDEDPETLSKRIAEKNAQIAKLESTMGGERPEMGSVNPNSSRGQAIKAQQDLYDQRRDMLKKALAERQELIKSLADAGNIIEKNAGELEAGAYRREISAKVNTDFKAGNEQVRKLEEEIQRKQEELVRTKPDATTVDYEKVGKEEREKIRQIRIGLTRDQVTLLQEEQKKLEDQLEKAADPQSKLKLRAKLNVLTEERKGLIDQAVRLAKDMEATGNVKTLKKPDGDKPIDPFLRYVEQLENEYEVAKQKLEANIEGVRGLAELRNEAVIKVLGDMAEGKFDKNIGKDADDVTRRKYVGDLEARKGFVKKFVEELKAGRGDVNEFINSLKTLDPEAKKLTLRAIEAASGLSLQAERQRALTQVQQLAVRATEDLDAAQVRFASNGLVKEDAAIVALNKQLAALGEKLRAGTTDFEAFNKAKNAAIRDTIRAGNLNFAADQELALRNATIEQQKAVLTVSEARKYEHEQELKRIAAEQDRREELTWEALATTALTAEEFQKEMTTIAEAGDKARAAAVMKHQVNSMTALDKLKLQWNDSVEQMNQATGRWASNFSDNLVEMIAGGKVKWKDFAASIAKDLLGIFVRKELGGAITSMMGTFGNKIGSAMGMIDPAQAAALSAQTTATTTAMSTVSAAATTSYATMTSATTGAMTMMGTAASALIAAATTMTSGAGSNMVAQLLGVAGGGISPRTFVNDAGGVEIAGSLGFANGGIMTSMGPASLKKYAAGGIATSPQLALFGEGSMNEAYVPLPDGRSIPVTLSGAANTTNMGGVQINIVVNKDGSTEQQSAGDDATQWQRVAQRVRSVVMEELVTQQRPGGVLYK